MKKAKYVQGYDLIPEGDRTVVSFNGDGISWAAYIVFPLVLIWPAMLLYSPLWFVPLILFSAIGYLIYLMFQRQTFTLTQDGIEKGGIEYDREKISEILIDNPMDRSVEITGHPSMIVGGTGVAGASMAAVGVMANATNSAVFVGSMAISRSSAKRRFRYGSKVVTLARNLKQDRAIAIFDLLTKE